ncbi:MAG: hypothetical protein HKO64_11835, partial [Xanthomonadales bacterium]|nr:hypothetical protein [Xanthomonadales bacterium]
MSRLLLFASLSLLLVSCSSVKSIREPDNAESDGLTYFMPKRDFLVTINVEGG